jgi:hypothetical protein
MYSNAITRSDPIPSLWGNDRKKAFRTFMTFTISPKIITRIAAAINTGNDPS